MNKLHINKDGPSILRPNIPYTATQAPNTEERKRRHCSTAPKNFEVMTSKEQSDRFVFINAPALVSAGTREDRRQVRSQLMRRLYQERQSPKGQSPVIIHTHTSNHKEAKESLAVCRCGDHRFTSSSRSSELDLTTQVRRQPPSSRSDSSDSSPSSISPPLRFSKIKIRTGDGYLVCSQCGGKLQVEGSKRRSTGHNNRKDITYSKPKHPAAITTNATKEVDGPLIAACLGSSKFDPFGGQGNNREERGYHELADHRKFAVTFV